MQLYLIQIDDNHQVILYILSKNIPKIPNDLISIAEMMLSRQSKSCQAELHFPTNMKSVIYIDCTFDQIPSKFFA